MLKRRRILYGIFGFFLFIMMLMAGCGKKADPIPPRLILPPAISDLRVESVAEGMLLCWTVSEPIGRIAFFRVIRSEEDAQQACLRCPQDYRLLATLKVDGQNLRPEEGNRFRYIDSSIAAGRLYSYRISACDLKGHCGEISAPARSLREQR